MIVSDCFSDHLQWKREKKYNQANILGLPPYNKIIDSHNYSEWSTILHSGLAATKKFR
jgi:hypothetical protein